MVIKNKSSALKNRPAGLKISSLDECSTSLFLEPVHWMKDLIHELSGKVGVFYKFFINLYLEFRYIINKYKIHFKFHYLFI